jgi:hypothetical protein
MKMSFYRIIDWDTGEVLGEETNIASAKKVCRKFGHQDDHNNKWYLPVAYVEDADGNCIYNPRFKVYG